MKQLIHKTVIIPDDSELFFVGDIHGCLDLLDATLKKAGFNKEKDYCICVGDLIDRGKQNLQVLARFLYGNERFQSVMGNHDAFMAYHQLDHQRYNWSLNGGVWALKEDSLDGEQINVIAQDMRSKLPVFMTVKHRGKTFGVVHGEVPNIFRGDGRMDAEYAPCLTRNWFDLVDSVEDTFEHNLSLKEMEYFISPYMWGRDVIAAIKDNVKIPPVEGVDYVFHGHTYVKHPVINNNRVYIDTGGVFNGIMTVATIKNDLLHFIN